MRRSEWRQRMQQCPIIARSTCLSSEDRALSKWLAFLVLSRNEPVLLFARLAMDLLEPLRQYSSSI